MRLVLCCCASRVWANISRMGMLVIVAVRVLEGVFVAGAIGSFLVLVLTGIEDIETLFGRGHAQENKQQES